MSHEDLVRFVRRDWAAVAEAKEREWLRQKRAMSPADALPLIDVMRRHARTMRPDWPSRGEREDDMATLAMLEKALGVSDLLPVFDRIVRP